MTASETDKKFDEKTAKEYADIASEVFKPIFPVIAEQTLSRCKITEGVCLELGCGPAHLSLSYTVLTEVYVYALDHSNHILKFARENVMNAGKSGWVIPLGGDVHHLPFSDDSVDLKEEKAKNEEAFFNTINICNDYFFRVLPEITGCRAENYRRIGRMRQDCKTP